MACGRKSVALVFWVCAITVILMALGGNSRVLRDDRMMRPCGEIYVVKDGETLQTISEKCNAPFILEDNPHILDTDDVSAGLVLSLRAGL